MNDENLNNNDKNLKTFDVKLDGEVDLDIEDLSFDVEGDAKLNSNVTGDILKGDESTSLYGNSNMIDTSDDNLSNGISSDNNSMSPDNINEDNSNPSIFNDAIDSSEGESLPEGSDQKDNINDDVNDVIDSNENKQTSSNPDDTIQNGSNSETFDSDGDNNDSKNKGNKDSNEKNESSTGDNDKKSLSEDKKGDDVSKKDQNKEKGPSQDKSDTPNKDKNGQGNKPDNSNKKSPKTQEEKDKDNAAKNMPGANNKYVNKANDMANKASKKADRANQRAQAAQKNADLRNKLNKNNTNPNKAKKMQRSADRANRRAAKAGKKALKAGKKADKARKVASAVTKFSKTLTIVKIFIAVVIFLVIIIFSVINSFGAVITPGQGNDIKDEFSNFSENDKKILEEVNGINGITKPNAELAIYTVLFPYFESLQDGSISTYLNGDSSELDEDEQKEYDENSNNSETRQKILESFGCDDLCQELLGSDGVNQIIKAYAKKSLKTKFKEFFGIDTSEDELDLDDLLENEESNNDENNNSIGEMDDPYLKLLSKSKYQKSLKILLEKLSSTAEDGDYESETEYFEYLKNTYFESDAGYKALLIQTDENNTEALKDAIIAQLKAGASLYEVYIADHCITSNASLTPLNSAGNINEAIQGDIYIRLRDYRQTGNYWVASDHFSSPILYGTDSNPLEFARYIMGVAYAEVGEGVKNEAVAKTIMVTAKSFTVGRYKSMGGEYPKPEFDEANNRTIIEMRGNVGDQDFCDVYEGCKEGTYAWSTRTEMRGSGDPKGPLSSNDIKNLEQWWNDIADVYVVNSSNGNFSGNQYAKYDDSCKKGSCVSQADVAIAAKKESDYMNILFNADNGGFDSDSYQAFNASTGGVYAVSTGNKYCPSSNITGSRQEIVNFAISMVGKIPYYFYEGQSDGYGALGHAINKNYDDNHFNEDASMTDHKGRNKYGLDCSGFVDFVFWNVLDDNLGNGNTKILRSKSYKLSSYSDLIPGDLGFLSDDGSGPDQHVGIYIGNDEWVELNPNGVTKGEYPNFKVFYRPNILAELDQQENMDVVLTGSTVYENPIPGEKISNAYGVKGDLWSRGYHTGSDFGNNTDGKEIHSIGEGTVYCISCKGSSFGNHVVIEHADGYYSLYAHMSNKPKVIKGQKVNHSTILGNVGSTGNVTGPHLHLEFWKGVPWGSGSQDLNPANYIKL